MENVHEQIQAKPTAAAGRHVPDRWRARNHADLSRRQRAAALCRLRPAEHRRGLEHAEALLPALPRERTAHGFGFILESATWRSSPDWGAKLGYSKEASAAANRDGIAMLLALRAEHETPAFPIVVSGAIGPRGDGYDPGQVMSADEAPHTTARRSRSLADTAADLVTAITMTNVHEAIGIARAAQHCAIPVMISFTLETDGACRRDRRCGRRSTRSMRRPEAAPAYYMINCAHPSHFRRRSPPAMRGSHGSAECAPMPPAQPCRAERAPNSTRAIRTSSASEYRELRTGPQITVLGGCCGTDHRHVACIGAAVKHAA